MAGETQFHVKGTEMKTVTMMYVLATMVGLAFGGGNPPVSTFTDSRDKMVYKTIKVGAQTWMSENLNYDANGSVCYENKTEICTKYGRLYNLKTALTACPAGYRLPSDKEWTALTNYVGEQAGKWLKSTSDWNDDGNGTDEYGFSALPGGYGGLDGGFDRAGNSGFWWSATERNANNAWLRGINDLSEYVYRYDDDKTDLYSVRCVQD
jgi:uncharacterized protein (TIGR02145 family)